MTQSDNFGRLSRTPVQLCGALVAAALAATGCGGSANPDTELDSISQDYASSAYVTWGTAPPRNSGGFTDSMAVCAMTAKASSDAMWDGVLILGRHASGTSANRFRYAMYYKLRGWLSWPDLGAATFNSKPVCASLNDADWLPSIPNWSNQVALVGKRSTDNRFHLRIMQLSTAGSITDPPSPPSFPVNWHSIASDTYASAPFAVVEYGVLVVGGRTSEVTPSHSSIYLHINPLTFANPNAVPVYSQSAWQPRVVLPALPSGWAAVGDPAITAEGNGIVDIVTRAQNASGQARLYTTTVFVPYLALFGLLEGAGGGPPTWTHIATGLIPVNSDPAIEFDTTRGELTVYYRGGNLNRVFQATRNPQTGAWPSFAGIHNDSFTTAPAATANVLLDWSHLVVARKSDDAEQVWWTGIDPRALE